MTETETVMAMESDVMLCMEKGGKKGRESKLLMGKEGGRFCWLRDTHDPVKSESDTRQDKIRSDQESKP